MRYFGVLMILLGLISLFIFIIFFPNPYFFAGSLSLSFLGIWIEKLSLIKNPTNLETAKMVMLFGYSFAIISMALSPLTLIFDIVFRIDLLEYLGKFNLFLILSILILLSFKIFSNFRVYKEGSKFFNSKELTDFLLAYIGFFLTVEFTFLLNLFFGRFTLNNESILKLILGLIFSSYLFYYGYRIKQKY
jgi:hypothetical protein